jgi:ElaB/YqjD/DUF883 family membrane-anchored ribosome-binding protein
MESTKMTKSSRSNHLDRMKEIRDQAAVVSQGLSGIAATAGAAATDQLEPIEKYVKKNPVRSMLLAAGIGAVLGVLFLRR